jgi:hypothetical protein
MWGTAGTISTDNTESGDVPGALALARLAFSHLREIEARVGGH